MKIAEAAVPAAQKRDALAVFRKIGEHLFPIFGQNLGADRHADHQDLAVTAGAVGPAAVGAAFSFEVLVIAEVDQRVEVAHGFKDDVAALAAVAAVRSAELDELLAPETDAA